MNNCKSNTQARLEKYGFKWLHTEDMQKVFTLPLMDQNNCLTEENQKMIESMGYEVNIVDRNPGADHIAAFTAIINNKKHFFICKNI